MLADNIHLYENGPAWDLAQAVKEQDTILIKNLCLKEPSLLKFQENKFGQTLIEWAVYTDRYQATKALAECGTDANIQSYNGTSAFIHAGEKCETSDYLKILLKYGGDVNAIAKNKETGV